MVGERTDAWRRFLIFVTVGVVTGVVLLHPAAMLIMDYQSPTRQLDWRALGMALSIQHLPMAIFFALLGAFVGVIYGILSARFETTARRLRLLEEILPICCVCKKIRNEESGQPGSVEWVTVEGYISTKTGAKFSHGYCPDCYVKAAKEFEDEVDQLKNAL